MRTMSANRERNEVEAAERFGYQDAREQFELAGQYGAEFEEWDGPCAERIEDNFSDQAVRDQHYEIYAEEHPDLPDDDDNDVEEDIKNVAEALRNAYVAGWLSWVEDNQDKREAQKAQKRATRNGKILSIAMLAFSIALAVSIYTAWS